ncbi:MAG TPA: glycosyltransferase family 2 protein [Vicinamibacterales bacterium]|nr:glycosyltransferase family 2 protein [Vicinamibacterales bacterium]
MEETHTTERPQSVMHPTTEPRVSVVTPVYNGASYLRECIESVLSQTYSNWDYTIINNNSTDDTLAIAQEYARKDPRVRVCSNDVLLDVISNHNRAFSLISPLSKYCKVVSADDWLFPECLARLVAVAETHPSVGLVGSYQLFGAGTDWRAWRVMWAEVPYPSTFIRGRDVCRTQMLGGPYIFGSPTSLLYRADLVRAQERFYPNFTAEADTSACYRELQSSDFGFVHQVLSYGRLHQETQSAVSKSVNAYQSSRLGDLMMYGPSFLTGTELAERAEQVLDDYYHYLAVSAVHQRDKKFWDYHKRRLTECGHPFSRVRFGKALAAKLLDLLLNPKQTVEKTMRQKALV